MRFLVAVVFLLILVTGPAGSGAAAQERGAAGDEETLEEFEPSEEISADTAVSFPVDI